MAGEIVIFDIDGTLADISGRVHCIRRKPKNWNAFYEGMAKDKAIHSLIKLCNILYASGLYVNLCSGPNENNRTETVEWLRKEEVNYHELLLRQDTDFRSDATMKSEILGRLDKSRILLAVEDRSRVVEMWRAEGLVCPQCAPGRF